MVSMVLGSPHSMRHEGELGRRDMDIIDTLELERVSSWAGTPVERGVRRSGRAGSPSPAGFSRGVRCSWRGAENSDHSIRDDGELGWHRVSTPLIEGVGGRETGLLPHSMRVEGESARCIGEEGEEGLR